VHDKVNGNGKETWSKPAEFRTGMLNSSDWKAQWITPNEAKRLGVIHI
jgi:hypothetical protein